MKLPRLARSIASPALVLVALMATGGDAAAGREAADDTVGGGAIATRLDEVNRSLQELVALMERMLDRQRAEILLRRIEIGERRVEPHAARLDRARSELDALVKERDDLATMKEMFEAEIVQARESGVETDRAEASEQQIAMIDKRVEQLEDRIDEQDRRVTSLDIDLARNREDLEDLDDLLAALLERLERSDDQRREAPRR